jgi:ankyrin repeat protein
MDPTDLIDAIKQGNITQAYALVETEPALAGAKTAIGVSMILLATYYGHSDIASMLATRVPTLDVYEASAIGDLARVKEIVSADPACVNSFAPDGFFPLGLAAFFGHADVADYLLAHGADPNLAANNPQHVTALHAATASANLAIARRLIMQGADVNARQVNNFVPLHNAAQNGQIEMIELLLSRGADVNAPSDDGKTALTFALEHEHYDAAKLLKQHGAQ